jgi:hypothetical protein
MPQAFVRSLQESKNFFFEKKQQKTSEWRLCPAAAQPHPSSSA